MGMRQTGSASVWIHPKVVYRWSTKATKTTTDNGAKNETDGYNGAYGWGVGGKTSGRNGRNRRIACGRGAWTEWRDDYTGEASLAVARQALPLAVRRYLWFLLRGRVGMVGLSKSSTTRCFSARLKLPVRPV